MPVPHRTPTRLAATLAAALLLVALIPAAARAADQASDTPEAAPLKELPDLVLTPWLSSQTKNGNFRRPSGTLMTDGYANVGLAYAMLLEAARSGQTRYFESAMKAIDWSTRTRYPMTGVFFQMFSAAAYNLAREKFGNRKAFKQVRPRWANQLRRFPYQRGVLGSHYRYNKNLVEALQVIELYNTGLRGNARNAILRNRKEALRRAVRLMNVWIPRRVEAYTKVVGKPEGWPSAKKVAEMSDPPDNPPAYNALTAGLFARAYSRLPVIERTERMRSTAETMIDGVIARAAPDGDIAFDGRSQEQAWALSSAAYAAWNASDFEVGSLRAIHLAFARRVVSRLENVHVTSKSSFGFVLTPAAGCCDRQDKPPGQDHYYDVGKYSGLTALTLGWALEERPDDWAEGSALLPTDAPSDFVFGLGRGRFYQHSGTDLYWFMRMQSDYYDARADMGLAVLKVRGGDGKWIDAVPPRPYTGGHHSPADPAAPCLVYRKGCAYLELHGGVPAAGGAFSFQARWRTARNTVVRNTTAVVTPTSNGLKLSWPARAADEYRVDTFLAKPSCANSGAIQTAHVSITISGRKRCGIFKTIYAGGSLTTLRKARLVAGGGAGAVEVAYTAHAG